MPGSGRRTSSRDVDGVRESSSGERVWTVTEKGAEASVSAERTASTVISGSRTRSSSIPVESEV
jgi:hypothetical protein